MPRFAILIHDHPFLHWDFLLENGNFCRTWRLLAAPDSKMTVIPAEYLIDHRLMYLDYEGPVSGDRGTVERWDSGSFEWRRNLPEICEVQLKGQRYIGIAQLIQIEGDRWDCRFDQEKP